MEHILELKEALKTHRVIEYDSFSNSGSTFYGRKVVCIYGSLGSGKNKIYFSKYIYELSDVEFEKYKDVILQEYNDYVSGIKKRNEFEQKKQIYISLNINKVKYPFLLINEYDSLEIIINPTEDQKKYGDCVSSKEQLLNDNEYYLTNIIFAFTEDHLYDCGYEYDDYITKVINGIEL